MFVLTTASMTCIAFVFASRTIAIYENARWVKILLFSCLPFIVAGFLVSAIDCELCKDDDNCIAITKTN